MATIVMCDVAGCSNVAVSSPWNLNGRAHDLCVSHLKEWISGGTPRAKKTAKTPAKKDGRGRKPMKPEEKKLDAEAKAWAIEQNLVAADRRGPVGRKIVDQYLAATKK